MRYSEWKRQLALFEGTVDRAQEELDRVTEERENFLRETLGFRSRDLATLKGTSEMIAKVFDMKTEESKNNV